MKPLFYLLFLIGFAVALSNARSISMTYDNFNQKKMKFNFYSFVIGITVPAGTKFSVSLANRFYQALLAKFGDQSYQYLSL